MQPTRGLDSIPTAGAPSPALASLRRFARDRAAVERCELCAAQLAHDHQHLLDRVSRQIACACDPCAILFCDQQNGKYVRVPRRIARLDGFSFSELQWQSMMLPINLAFFVRQPDGGTRAMYPSPAGPMESLISLPAWETLFAGQRALASVEPEVEALLANRIGESPLYFIVPIDACYRLIGLIRTKWRGLSGGGEVWQAIGGFFSDLDQRATRIDEAHHA